MFDKKPPLTPASGDNINFLHGQEDGAPKRKPAPEPAELVHVSKDASAGSTQGAPGLFQRLTRLFSRKNVAVKATPTTVQSQTQRNGGSRASKSVSEIPLPKVALPARKEAVLGAVDPFEETAEIQPQHKNGERVLQPSIPSHPESEQPGKLAGEPEHSQLRSRERYERFKKTPLSELGKKASDGAFDSKMNTPLSAGKQDTLDTFDVNLLPAQKKRFSIQVKKWISLGLVSFEFLILLMLFLLLQARADGGLLVVRDLEAKAAQLDIQTKRYQTTVAEATQLQKKAGILKTLFAERNDPARALAWLEANTMKTIFLENFSTAADGMFLVSVAASDVQSGAQQLKLFLSASWWKRVDVRGLSLREDEAGGTSVAYSVEFEPVPEFYHPK